MSKIPVHYSLVVARKVVRRLEKILPEEIANNCTIESWSNGREQGLCVSFINGIVARDWKSILIAQQRCSDNILIIYGNGKDFDISTNGPSERIWNNPDNRIEFHYDEVKEAAKYILDILEKPLTVNKQCDRVF